MSPFGLPRLHLRSVASTNTRAAELAMGGAPHGTLVTTEEQTAGRGRQGRTWTMPRGEAIAASWVLRSPPPLLPHVAAVAVAEVADAHDASGREVAIKWPNDVLVGGLKVAGILGEGRPQENWAVLGIGLNVAIAQDAFPEELRARATSLGLTTGDVERVLAALTSSLDRWLAASEADLLAVYRERDALIGRAISWAGGTGTASGIADDGRLRVRAPAGTITHLEAGEVHIGELPPTT